MQRRIENVIERIQAWNKARATRLIEQHTEEKKTRDYKRAEQLITKMPPRVQETLRKAGCYTSEQTIQTPRGREITLVQLHYPKEMKNAVFLTLSTHNIIDRSLLDNDLTVQAIQIVGANQNIEPDEKFAQDIRDLLQRLTQLEVEDSIKLFTGMISEEQLERMRIPKVEQRPRN